MGSALRCKLFLPRVSFTLCWKVRRHFKPALDYVCTLCAPCLSWSGGCGAFAGSCALALHRSSVRALLPESAMPVSVHLRALTSALLSGAGRVRVALLSLVLACILAVALRVASPSQSARLDRERLLVLLARLRFAPPVAASRLRELSVQAACSPVVMLRIVLLCIVAATARSDLPPGITGACQALPGVMRRGVAPAGRTVRLARRCSDVFRF